MTDETQASSTERIKARLRELKQEDEAGAKQVAMLQQ